MKKGMRKGDTVYLLGEMYTVPDPFSERAQEMTILTSQDMGIVPSMEEGVILKRRPSILHWGRTTRWLLDDLKAGIEPEKGWEYLVSFPDSKSGIWVGEDKLLPWKLGK